MLHKSLKPTLILAAVVALIAGVSGATGVARADHCPPGQVHYQASPSSPVSCVQGSGNGTTGGGSTTTSAATGGDGGQPSPDSDGDDDGRPDNQDNCPDAANPDQADADNDGKGDVCDENAERNGSNGNIVTFQTGPGTEQIYCNAPEGGYFKAAELAPDDLRGLAGAWATNRRVEQDGTWDTKITVMDLSSVAPSWGTSSGAPSLPDTVTPPTDTLTTLRYEGNGLFTGNIPACADVGGDGYFWFHRDDVISLNELLSCEELLTRAQQRVDALQERFDRAINAAIAAAEAADVANDASRAAELALTELLNAQAVRDELRWACESPPPPSRGCEAIAKLRERVREAMSGSPAPLTEDDEVDPELAELRRQLDAEVAAELAELAGECPVDALNLLRERITLSKNPEAGD